MRIPARGFPAAVAALAASLALLAAAPAKGRRRPPSPPAAPFGYTLGPETIPNGAFDRLNPDAPGYMPDGWVVGFQGGERNAPIPGKDPESGDRCMVFLYEAGRVDLATSAFPLVSSGPHLFSARLRSVVNPAERALRVVVRLLPPEKAASPPPERVVERFFAAGPPEREWATRTALIDVPPGYARAEVHLVKAAALSDFLVDDVSLRRIVEAPREMRLDAPSGGPAAWTSPVLYLGPVGSASIVRWPGAARAAGPAVEARTGTTAEPGPAWEGWLRIDRLDAGGPLPIHLVARGVPLFAQLRVSASADPADGATAGPTAGSPAAAAPTSGAVSPAGSPPAAIVLITEPAPAVLSPRARISPPTQPAPEAADAGGGWRSIVLPPPGECLNGSLQPIRTLALEAAGGLRGDLLRAAALRDALRSWAPFTAAEDPQPGTPAPNPAALLTDCRRASPRYCRGWEADLITAGCRCLGMTCRAVSTSAAGGGPGGLEGFEVWSAEQTRWIYLDLSAGVEVRPPGPPSALDLAAERRVKVAVASDLRWGRRGWLIHDPSPPEAEPGDEDDLEVETVPRDAIDFPVGAVHVDLSAAAERSLEIHLDHSMPGFTRYLYRHLPSTPWRAIPKPLIWTLAPGDNAIEIRAQNDLGGVGPAAVVRARLDEEASSRAAAYAGLRPLGGDPHVHTGLGLYIMNPSTKPLATGTPEGVFASAIENGLDWAAVSDSSRNIDDPRTIEWRRRTGRRLRNPDGTETDSEWDHLKAVARQADQPGRFAAFLAIEFQGDGLSSRGGTGDKIILLPDESPRTYCSSMPQNVGDCPLVEDAYRYAREHGGVMMAVSPCPIPGLDDTDWVRHDPVVALLDLYGGRCEEGRGGLIDVAVRKGIRIGVGGGSDSRRGVAGEFDRTICWAREISRPAILEAIRERRCYWSAAGDLDLSFTINGAPMGAEVASGAVTAWSVLVESESAPAFGTVEVLRDGEVIVSASCESASRCAIEGGAGEGWPGVYYAAVNAPDGERLAITSPVYVLGEGAPPRR